MNIKLVLLNPNWINRSDQKSGDLAIKPVCTRMKDQNGKTHKRYSPNRLKPAKSNKI